MTLDGHGGMSLDVDLCAGCHVLWFDRFESLRLSPGATLKIFGVIGEQSEATRRPVAELLRCPRCSSRLRLTNDLQRNTRFRYWSCSRSHGRLITFFDFLREKDFIRPLSATQVEELRRHVLSVNCSNCGAPVDLAKGSSCGHCGSPLSMLDMKQAERVVARLREAAQPRTVDPSLPLELARARREVEAAFATTGGASNIWHDTSSFGIVEAGLAAMARWLKKCAS